MILRGLLVLTLFCLPQGHGSIQVQNGLKPTEYSDRFNLTQGNLTNRNALQNCLKRWKNHPFGKKEAYLFRVLTAQENTLGFGQLVVDRTLTTYPQIVLVEPTPAALLATEYRLLNPQGWYCLRSHPSVMAKHEVTGHCDSKIIASSGQIEEFVSIKRVGCKKPPTAKSQKP